MEFNSLEELQKYNQEQFEKLDVNKIATYKTEEEIANYWERINFNSRPHDVFKSDWQHYYSLDFADTLLSYADGIQAKGLDAFDGAELFLHSQKSDRKLYLLDDNQYLINIIAYTYPKGVKAEENKKYVQVGKDEVLTFMEINQENKIDIHFKFGERFAKHVDDYAKENKLSISARSIESTVYKTNKETVEKNFKESFVHYDMMKFVLETIGVKLNWYNEPQITKAYFAKQVVKPQKIQHKVATGDLYPKIAKKYGTTVEKIAEMNKLKKNKIGKYPIKIGQVLDIDSSRPKDTNLEYEPITSAKLGESIYVVFETKNMLDKMINIKVKQGKDKGIAEKDQAIEMFLHDNLKSDLDMTIGKGAKSSKYKNKDQFLDFAFGKVVLIPNEGSAEKNDSKKEEDKVILKKWNDILNKLQTKSTFLYLYAESKDAPKVFYDGSKKNEFLMVKASKKEKCYCGRDIELSEMKEIIKSLRDSEKETKNEYLLFNKYSNIEENNKTYKFFTENINKIFEKYHINTCLRKIHFLAQAYHETNRFRSTREEGGEEYLKKKDYYPFYGRGLMQLTWEGKEGSGRTGYKQYFDHLERTDYIKNYKEVDSNVNLAFDSGGWFWEQGKTLSNAKPGIWKSPNFEGYVGDAVAKEGATTKKIIRKYGKNKKEYGTIDLNALADNDWIDTISWLVNGGGNGFDERRKYLKTLKEIIKYEKCINNK